MTRPRTTRRAVPLLILVTGAGLLATACASQGSVTESSASQPSATASMASPTALPSLSPTPTPSPTPQLLSPLNGLPIDAPRPVLVVKLDNTTYAQPHAGLSKADLVYLEEVEYGITRIAAVFSSRIPTRIGPVRSARITDIDLLAQYGSPAFGFSGAQRKMWPVLAAAPFHDISPNKGAEGYSRDSNRRAPYNYYLDGRVGIARAPRSTEAHDIGFVFDASVPAGGLTATSAKMVWGYASAGFRYDEESGLYAVNLNGQRAQAEEADAGQNAATVVIQYVTQRPSAYFDKGGGNTPHAETIGTGKAVVLRDGLAWKTTWSRPTAESGTTFTLPDGSTMPFKPGQPWVVLLDRERKATIKPLTDPSASPTASASPAATSSAATPTPSGSFAQ